MEGMWKGGVRIEWKGGEEAEGGRNEGTAS